MDNYLPENETIQFEDRTYVNPEASLQEQNAFIDNLRNVQNQNNAEIATDTYNLGTAIPSNLGGLGGGESYFTSRYQVPQGVALANNLRATAQAQALNDILSNEQAMMKQRYTNAQKAARQRAAARAAASYGGGNGGGGGNTSGWNGEIEDEEISGSSQTIEGAVPGVNGGYVVGNFIPETGQITGYTGVPYGQDYKINYNYSYADGAPKTMDRQPLSGSSTVFSGDKNRYLGLNGRLQG